MYIINRVKLGLIGSVLMMSLGVFGQKNQLFQLVYDDVKSTKDVFNNNLSILRFDTKEPIINLNSIDTIIKGFLDAVAFEIYVVNIGFNGSSAKLGSK